MSTAVRQDNKRSFASHRSIFIISNNTILQKSIRKHLHWKEIAMGEIIDNYLIKTADELDNSEIEWLIPEWIPCRGITLLCSDGGIGKSFLWVSIASALSKGNRTILDSGPIFRNEKKILCFLVRIRSAFCENVLKILRQNWITYSVLRRILSAPEFSFNSPNIAKTIEKVNPDLMIFDPLQAFIGSCGHVQKKPDAPCNETACSQFHQPIIFQF